MTSKQFSDGQATLAIHAGEPRPRSEGAVTQPIYQSSTFESAGEENYHDVRYIRLNNTPNHTVLHDKLAALENTQAALVTSSGMAAITTALLATLQAGDHVLTQKDLYGGTHTFVVHELEKFGIAFSFIDANDATSWQAQLRPNTKAVYVESMTNPLMRVANLQAIAEFAQANNLVSMIDNTLASPVNFQPANLGFDLVLHSATKYLNGHSDIVAGVVAGPVRLLHEVKKKLDHLGGSLDPHACFLLQRGLKTLVLRVQQHNRNGQAMAELLQAHEKVSAVHYPGLQNDPGHTHAQAWFTGCCGLLSFEHVDGLAGARRLIDNSRLACNAVSLGGVETLITLPALTTHQGMSTDERKALGFSDGLVRLAVGIEDTDDLLADMQQALDRS